MRVTRIVLENFKRFEDLEIDVRNQLTRNVAEQFLVLGDNGTGKTSVLQAVALCLSLATWKTRDVGSFRWPGWVPGRYSLWGSPVVELTVELSPDEIAATREVARRWLKSQEARAGGASLVEPGDSRTVALRLEGESCSASSEEELCQFRGRWYAGQVLKTDPSVRELYESLPGVFWFDQFRNLASVSHSGRDSRNGDDNGETEAGFRTGVDRLRQDLNSWQLDRLSIEAQHESQGHDFLSQLENSYKRVFPGRSFKGAEPMYRNGVPTPAGHYFVLSDGHRTYDIEEMSAGEQAVFPMLYEFVRMQIRNCVVLIDEIDLSLHPPLAQSLLAALPSLGPSCQFLFTTHAEAISDLVSPEQVFRLPGGRLCL